MSINLSTNEKYIIQGRLHANEDVQTIAKAINRHVKTVQSYIDGELNKIHETVAEIQLQQEAEKTEQEEKRVEQLEEAEAAKKTTKPRVYKPKNDQFINKTAGGKTGVAISTQAASEKSELIQKSHPRKLSRTVRGNTFDIKKQKIRR